MTLREHLEEIVERNAPTRPHHNPGDDYRDAVAALAILDNANRFMDAPNAGPPGVKDVRVYTGYRLVPDPEDTA